MKPRIWMIPPGLSVDPRHRWVCAGVGPLSLRPCLGVGATTLQAFIGWEVRDFDAMLRAWDGTQPEAAR